MCRPEPCRSDSPYPGRGFRSLTQALSASACQPLATVRDTSHVSPGFSRLVLPRDAAAFVGATAGGRAPGTSSALGGRAGAAAARSCRDGRGVGPGHRAGHGPGGKRVRRGHCRGGPEGDPRHRAGEPGHTRYGGLLRTKPPRRARATTSPVSAGGARSRPAHRGTAGLSRREAAATGMNGDPRHPELPRHEAAAATLSPVFWDTGAGTGETDPLSRTCRPAPHSPAPSTAHTAAAAHPAPAP